MKTILFLVFSLSYFTMAQIKYSEFNKVEVFDESLNSLLEKDAKLEILEEGFIWSEGPIWNKKENYLLFTDVPKNTIYKWEINRGVTVYLRPSGYYNDNPPGNYMGANGLLFDMSGNLVICEHGNRLISRLNPENFTRSIIVDNYNGKKFNSPNDLILSSNGDLYFTDPPYGLGNGINSSLKELTFSGIFLLDVNNNLTLLSDAMDYPNGIALSPEEKILYVNQSTNNKPFINKFLINPDGTIGTPTLFFDGTKLKEDGRYGSFDGMVIDIYGNLFTSGPGGVLVIDPTGKLLGIIDTGGATANCTFGDNGSTLYITAGKRLVRIKTKTKGVDHN